MDKVYLEQFRIQARTLGSGNTTRTVSDEEGKYFTEQAKNLTERTNNLERTYQELIQYATEFIKRAEKVLARI